MLLRIIQSEYMSSMSLLFKVLELLTSSRGAVCSQRQARPYLQGGRKNLVPRLPQEEGHPSTLTFFIHGCVCKAGRVTLGLGLPYDLIPVTSCVPVTALE